MMQYSLLDRRPEETCLELLKENNIGVLSRGALAQGLLVNKPAKEYLNFSREEVSKAAAAIHSISNKKRTASETAIRFVLHNPAITCAVIGMRTFEQLNEIANVSETPVLTSEEIKEISNAIRPNIYEQHRWNPPP